MRISDWSSDVCSSDLPVVRAFFDEPSFTVSYVVHDPETRAAAIIDSVLDFDVASGRTAYGSAQAMIAYVKAEGLKIEWLLETHAHADHLSAAPYLQRSEEHTSELQSLMRISYAVCCLKKKTQTKQNHILHIL